MEYKTYPPNPTLANHVKYYWSLENFEDMIPHSRERVFPDGCIELLFHYGDLFRKFHPDGTVETQPRSFIHGQITQFIELEATAKVGIFSVRFHPTGLQSFIDFEVSKLTNSIMSVEQVWPHEGVLLEKEIITATSNEERVRIIEKFLNRKCNMSSKYETIIQSCVTAISESGGTTTMKQLVDNFDISQRQLERMFLSHVGLSLKSFSRIVRFNQALQLISKKDFSSFTSVAHEGGFYDQAHFIKDFKELTGLNPKQYFSENLEMVKFFNLDF